MPGAGHSFFVFGRNQYHRKLRTHVDSTFGRIQYHKFVAQEQEQQDEIKPSVHKPSGRIMKMRRTGKVWVLDVVVAKDMISPELFSRQG